MNLFFFIILGSQLPKTLILIGITIWFIQAFCYTYIAFSNPGIPSFNNRFKAHNNEDGLSYKECPFCKLYYTLDSGTNHCRTCDVCIEGIIN